MKEFDITNINEDDICDSLFCMFRFASMCFAKKLKEGFKLKSKEIIIDNIVLDSEKILINGHYYKTKQIIQPLSYAIIFNENQE